MSKAHLEPSMLEPSNSSDQTSRQSEGAPPPPPPPPAAALVKNVSPSHEPSAPPYANTAPPPPFWTETHAPLVACKPTASPELMLLPPVRLTILNVSQPSRLALPALSDEPPPLSA